MKTYLITSDMNPEIIADHLDPRVDFHYCPCQTEDDIIEHCSDAEILISIYEPVTERVIRALDHLQYIAVGSIGFNYVDVDYAKDQGVAVSNNPTYCTEEVADHTVGLILDRVLRLSDFRRDVQKNHHWDFNAMGNTLKRMSNLTVALMGFGRTARQVAKRLKAFGCQLIIYDPYVSKQEAEDLGVEKVDLGGVQERADIISLHMPLFEDNYHIIDRDFLQNLKQSPIILNLSRGELIDQAVLKEALDKGWISGLGLDVLEDEIPQPDFESIDFLEDPRVIITPHVAFYSQASVVEADTTVASYINHYIDDDQGEIPFVI